MLRICFSNPIISEDMQEMYERLPETIMLRGKKIYISGASGMIASYMVAYLIWLNEKKNYQIQIYAGIRKKEKAITRYGKYSDKDYFHTVSTDVIKPLKLNVTFDYVIHAASLASPQYYGDRPVETILPNIIGTYNLLEYCKNSTIKGFLFFSSESIYGRVDGVSKINEDDCGVLKYLDQGSIYGESKRDGELLCYSYFSEYKVPTVFGRISHTYGPTIDVNGDKRVFAEFVKNVLDGRNIEMKSDGTAVRQFAYITDTAVGLFKMLLIGNRGNAYNVGNDQELYSIYQLAQIMTELRPQKGLKVIRAERNDKGYNLSTGHNKISNDTEKLKQLDWKPLHDVREGFDRTLKAIEWDQNL